MQLSQKIDHTNLRPDSTSEDIRTLCSEALEHQFKAVCVSPYHVRDAVRWTENHPTVVSTVIGFPMGYSATPAKVEEIKRAIDEGAQELDVVINLSALKSNQWNHVANDIDSVTRAVHLKGKVIKLILETGLLTTKELEKACQICQNREVDFVKTSTGFHGRGADVETVKLLRSLLPPAIKIKASGGIRSHTEALALIKAGADRLGTSAGVRIISKTATS
ncbi:MAG: deoxyribose-phosphate aldolase [Bacteroidota bacterium]